MRKSHGLYADMNKDELLKMRSERFMSNSQIAHELGVSQSTIYNLIGPMPKEMLREKRKEWGYKGALVKYGRDYQNTPEEEPATPALAAIRPEPPKPEEKSKPALAIKPSVLQLWGDFGHYTISEARDMIDVENGEGRVLINVPADKLDTFIAELSAISRNIAGSRSHVEMW